MVMGSDCRAEFKVHWQLCVFLTHSKFPTSSFLMLESLVGRWPNQQPALNLTKLAGAAIVQLRQWWFQSRHTFVVATTLPPQCNNVHKQVIYLEHLEQRSVCDLHSKIQWRKSNRCPFGSRIWLNIIAHVAMAGERRSSAV
jgi:hypothetical protein